MRKALDDQLERFAEELEEDTRKARDWDDDTGSGAEAITAYLVGKGEPRKNFTSPRWLQAQATGSQRYPNSPRNYYPHIESVDVGEDENKKVVILTNFIPYIEYLEHGWGLHHPGGNLLATRPAAHLGHLVTRVSFAILKAIRDAG